MTSAAKSRHSQKGKTKQKSTLTHTTETKKWLIYGIIAVLAATPFIMGKYIEFNSPGAYDSGGYVYSAKHILEGAVIGVDERPSAKLGTLIVNIIGVWLFGYNEIGPEIIQTLMQASALILVFVAMRRLFGILPAAISVIMASTFLSAPIIAKFGNVKEQYMIASMMLGISSFVIYQLKGKWHWAILAGFFASWAPLFKETGNSALAAIGLFVILQPVLKNRRFKQTGIDILLLVAGFMIAIAPLYIWLEVGGHRGMRPYSFAFKPIKAMLKSPEPKKENPPEIQDVSNPQIKKNVDEKGFIQKLLPRYVTGSWKALKTEQRKEVVRRVFRYYKLLLLPIALALASIIACLIRFIMSLTGKLSIPNKKVYDRFVLLFAVWWLFDMSFVWVSPRSYEQYYLPLNASAAMLGGYIIALYWDWTVNRVNKMPCIAVGAVGLLLMIILSWHIFFGIETSPHSNTSYGRKKRGYIQRLSEAYTQNTKDLLGYWQIAGRYIRMNSQPEERIYVWGWYPGIYVEAQRLGAALNPGIATMHTMTPEELSRKVTGILKDFEKKPPRFIVDTHKPHFPWDRPPLELWPTQFPWRDKKIKKLIMDNRGFLKNEAEAIQIYNKNFYVFLRDRVSEDEAERYNSMQPLREYVMNNYRIERSFGKHILFKRK
ncbi:MAG: ArnT family glycosyltransferase [Planctomycetota bacterium]|jgi:hypothetical protein